MTRVANHGPGRSVLGVGDGTEVGVAAPHYVIRGGLKGRERLRVLARVMWPSTRALLEPRVSAHARCLDVGCGGGDVSLALARLACDGSVLGVDVDETKLALARGEALAAGIRNVEFRTENVLEPPTRDEKFDVIYARFVLSHLPDPARAVSNMCARLAPGGVLIVEDIDASGQFCHPPSAAFARFVELYSAVVHAAAPIRTSVHDSRNCCAPAASPTSGCMSCTRRVSRAR